MHLLHGAVVVDWVVELVHDEGTLCSGGELAAVDRGAGEARQGEPENRQGDEAKVSPLHSSQDQHLIVTVMAVKHPWGTCNDLPK